MKGILGKKIGMSQIYDSHGNVIPITIVSVIENIVSGVKTLAKDNYVATQLAFDEAKPSSINRSKKKHFEKLNTTPKRYIREIRKMEGYSSGNKVDVTLFTAGEYVDVTSTSKGKGFAGAIKRHNYSRGPMSHGSHFHRSPGSLGAITQNRVFKGKKLPGHMGHERITTKNLMVVQVDSHNHIMLLKGNVAGHNNCLLLIKDAFKSKGKPIILSNIFEVDVKNKILEEAKKYNLDLTTEMPLEEMNKLLAKAKIALEKAEKAEKAEKLKLETEKAEKLKLETEKAEKLKLETEKAEKLKLETEKAEKLKLETAKVVNVTKEVKEDKTDKKESKSADAKIAVPNKIKKENDK